MNHKIPPGFKEDNKLFLDISDANNMDVYLIRVPKGFDIAKLNGSEFSAGEIKEIEVEVGANQLTSVYELSAFSGQGLDVSPLIKSREISTLGSQMKGFLSVNKSYRADLPISNDIAAPAARVTMPDGLRVRFQPFGAGTPFKPSSVKKKKKRKRRHSLDTSDSQPTLDVPHVKKRQKTHDEADPVQHSHKKHKNKKRKSYLICSVILWLQ